MKIAAPLYTNRYTMLERKVAFKLKSLAQVTQACRKPLSYTSFIQQKLDGLHEKLLYIISHNLFHNHSMGGCNVTKGMDRI